MEICEPSPENERKTFSRLSAVVISTRHRRGRDHVPDICCVCPRSGRNALYLNRTLERKFVNVTLRFFVPYVASRALSGTSASVDSRPPASIATTERRCTPFG